MKLEQYSTIDTPALPPSLSLSLSPAYIMSHIMATSQPPPRANPLTAAIVGLGHFEMTSQCDKNFRA